MNKFLTVIGIIGLLFIGVLIFGISVMGDRYCKIEIMNDGDSRLILKTFEYTNYDKKLTVDSINLNPKQRIEIGQCINCNTIKHSDIDFDSIGIYNSDNKLTIWKSKDFADFLTKTERVDCATFKIK